MKKKTHRLGKQKAKQYFLQDTGQWNKDIFVCTGLNAKEILAAVKRYKPKKWVIEFIEHEQGEWEKLIEKGCAFCAAETGHGSFVLRLRAYEDCWEFWETLIHELSHLVDYMAERQAFEKESEARAYLQEFLFHKIRRKLRGSDPKPIR